jgi:aspartyl aminopeptidase
VTKDGRKVEVKIGDNMGDPVFSIPDLLPHLSIDHLEFGSSHRRIIDSPEGSRS